MSNDAAHPIALLQPMRVAFYGRTARAQPDAQLNNHLAGQYLACVHALPTTALVTAVFYDLGSTNWLHPHPPDHFTIGRTVLRRDGGLADLVTEARHPGGSGRFDYLIAAGPDRLHRNRHTCLMLLTHLHRLGIGTLFAEPGPMLTTDLDQLVEVAHHADRGEATTVPDARQEHHPR